jgi:hypothetical protein
MTFSCFQVAMEHLLWDSASSERSFPEQRHETFAKDGPKKISCIERLA